tara:strand:+ start:66 stop:680 length:615 start_codon:yes stop_codon:yes gene_type:complete
MRASVKEIIGMEAELFREGEKRVMAEVVTDLSEDTDIYCLSVEIGTRQGKGAAFLCEALALRFKNFLLVSVDKASHKIVEAARKWEEKGRLVLRHEDGLVTARECGLQPHLLFIDGCHCHDCVADDIKAWAPKMAPRGVIVLHDTCPELQETRGPTRKYRCNRSGEEANFGVVDAIKLEMPEEFRLVHESKIYPGMRAYRMTDA